MARSATRIGGGTITVVVEEGSSSSARSETVVLRLSRPKKKVTWKEGTVDNEFLGKKSSKKCCIFHKQKPFDEDYSSDEEDHGIGKSDGGGGAGNKHEDGFHDCCSSHGESRLARD